MQTYFNQTKINLKKKIGVTWAHPPTPALNRVNDCNLGSRQPRRLKFDMQAYFNPTKRNLKIYWGQLTLDRVNKCYMRFSQPRRLKFNLQAHFKSTKTLTPKKNSNQAKAKQRNRFVISNINNFKI